jgi:tetratricopeptide (TPR) repeat protein
MVDDLLGADHRAPALRDRVVATSQGNPLFMEQLIQMLMDRGSLRREDGCWAQGDEASDLALPPTIQALLAARVDGLPRDERGIAQTAALVGYEFALPAIDAVVDAALRPRLGDGIASLIGRQFVRPDPDLPPEEEGYRFRNQLIREAAYEGLLKRARVTLHERYVAWADEVNRERGRELEFEEVLGYHLEKAYQYRTEFGPPDAAALAVGQDAARRLASAGRRSFLRGDMHAAASLLRRATSLLPDADQDRLALLPELGETLVELGAFAEAEEVLGAALAAAEEIGDDGLRARAMLIRLLLRMYTGDERDWARQVADETEAAMRVFERLEDHDGLARTWRLRFGLLQAACRYGEAHVAAERIVAEASLAGNLRLEARGAVGVASAALWGPTAVEVAIRECEELIARVAIDRRTVGLILCFLGQLRAMHGDFEAARSTYRDARSTLEELGRSVLSVSTSANSWRTEMLAGDPVAAEAELRRDYAALQEMGERYVLSTITGALAQVVWVQGRDDEADALTRSAEELSSADDVESQALWRSVRAKVQARRGMEGAAALASEAVELVRRTEAPSLLAETLVDLAETLVLADRPEQAVAPLREALSLSETKGDVVSARRVAARLAALVTGQPAGA